METKHTEVKNETDFEEIPLEEDQAEKIARILKTNLVEKEEKEEPISWKRELLSWILTFAFAIGVALFLKNFIIINATVPTGSMENTIMPGDDMLGFRLAYLFSEPERGDIIIFRFPDDESQKFVKRIIGLPGETVTIKDGYVYINDSTEPLMELYLKEEWVRGTGPYTFEVPQDSYFVMGDNRNHSTDSRDSMVGMVPVEYVIGEAVFRFMPFDSFGLLEG